MIGSFRSINSRFFLMQIIQFNVKTFKLTPAQTFSVVKQVGYALAAAHSRCALEHRDLHGDNVLVQRGTPATLTYKVGGKEVKVETAGVTVKIIDYGLSRAG